ncbi:sugar transferase [Phenylobacterium sp.]|uniref:sugar transferase n=1 Tax=Phenylobacterium sp. TaxID=1871053 RepID=UPI002F3F7F49
MAHIQESVSVTPGVSFAPRISPRRRSIASGARLGLSAGAGQAGALGRGRDVDLNTASEAVQKGIALALLVFLLPLMAMIALAVRLQDGGPALFKHRRVGQGGAAFRCWKFRTMRVDAAERLAELLAHDPEARREWERDQKLRNDPRVTPLGAFLRKSSLDELPQLINLLRGEMNLVGPRPIVEAEIARYGWRYRHYQAVKPGITGLWQVSGRNHVDYRTRVALDSLYSQRRNMSLDVWILLRTAPAVLFSRGCY